MSARLEVIGLRKSFGARCALAELTHAFAPGRITAIVGPSGSGKSTALALIAGLLEPDAGRVLLDGEDISARPPERRDFGVVFQSYALFPHLTVRHNAEFGLRVRGVPRAQRRQLAEEALARAHIAHLAERRVQQLSGGEQQRVALARALAFRPRVLMLDEPLSALDAPLREQLRAELAALLPALGVTALYVTHDQLEALSLGHELLVLNAGRIEQRGRPQDVYARPQTPFVASFLGAANLLEARCVARGAQRWLELPFAQLQLGADAPLGPCWAVLRPEDFELAAASAELFRAAVESAVFLGDRVRLRLRAAGSALVADVPSREPPAVGAELALRLRAAPPLLPRPAAG